MGGLCRTHIGPSRTGKIEPVADGAREAQVQTTCTSQALSIQGKNRRSSAIKRGNTNGMAVTRSTKLSGPVGVKVAASGYLTSLRSTWIESRTSTPWSTSPSERSMKGYPVIYGASEGILGLFAPPLGVLVRRIGNWVLLGESSRTQDPYISAWRYVDAGTYLPFYWQ